VISKYESKRVEFLSIGVSVLISEKRPLTQKIVSADGKGYIFFSHDLAHIDERISHPSESSVDAYARHISYLLELIPA
jgi:hypothetical protein